MLDPVLLAADDADLDLEDGVDRLHPGEDLLRDLEVLVERHGRAVPHVRLEDRVATRLHLFLGGGDERIHEVVEGVLRAVVGVQRDGDRVALRDLVGEAGERERTGGARLDGVAGEVVGAARGDLDDAVGARLGEPLQHGVERLRGGDVERREGEALRLGGVEHLGVLLRGGDGHGAPSR